MANIGQPTRRIHIEPAPIPEESPYREDSPHVAPAENPTPEHEPALVPA